VENCFQCFEFRRSGKDAARHLRPVELAVGSQTAGKPRTERFLDSRLSENPPRQLIRIHNRRRSLLREECRHTALAGCDASNEAEDCDGPDDDEEWPDGRGIWIPDGQVRRKPPANQDFRKLAGVHKPVKLDH
jgi:hypothetical protein